MRDRVARVSVPASDGQRQRLQALAASQPDACWTVPDVARLLGCSVRTAYSRVRELLSQGEAASLPSALRRLALWHHLLRQRQVESADPAGWVDEGALLSRFPGAALDRDLTTLRLTGQVERRVVGVTVQWRGIVKRPRRGSGRRS